MNKEQLKSLIDRIKKGMSTKEDDRILEELIASGRLELEDFEEINHLSRNLVDHLLIDPPTSMDDRFYQMLAKNNQKATKRSARLFNFKTLALVASFLLLLGFFAGYLLHRQNSISKSELVSQLNELKEEVVISKLDNKSTSSRLQAVGLTQNLPEVSHKITEALLMTINNDPSDNVRIASIEALIPYGQLETVRSGLINAIPQQKSPLVLISLAEALQKIGAVQSVDQFKNQLNKEIPPSLSDAFEKDLKSVLTDKL